MRIASCRALVAPAVLAVALGCAGCGTPEETPAGSTPDSPTSELDRSSRAAPVPAARSDGERAFLDDLTEFGLPTGMSAETTVEVGIGICENIADGAGTDTILTHIRPLSSAIASQSADHDSDRVGRAIVEASRTHLCD